MKKIAIISLTVVVVLFVAFKLYKKWQYDSMGYTQPQRETVQAIAEFSKSNVFGHVLIPKDSSVAEDFFQHFGYSICYLIDGNYNVISDNITNHNGNCYSDIVEAIRHDFDMSRLKKGNFDNGKLLLDSLLASTIAIGDSIDLRSTKYDYIFIYGWAKFCKTSYADHPMRIKEYLDAHPDKKMLVLAVNNDYVDNWYGTLDPVPGLPQ